MRKRFKFNQSVASESYSYKSGDEAIIDAEQAKNWEACGYGSIVADSEQKK